MSAGFVLLVMLLVLAVFILAAYSLCLKLKNDHMVMVEDPCDRQLVNIVLRLPEKDRVKLESDIRKGEYNG
ncbi:hypothetical protein PODOV084v1_p0019 [Vibrio phage 340E47.2]|nr:hypothetical protein PODOV084v1_p0019 [Vibrio phage 340E47.2]QZI91924.1 hypothetical protein PODOV077v1_p0013 [Vibrio phage 5P1a]